MIARFADPSTRQIALRVVRHAVFLRRATGIRAILEYPSRDDERARPRWQRNRHPVRRL
jgi:hypothetical protein